MRLIDADALRDEVMSTPPDRGLMYKGAIATMIDDTPTIAPESLRSQWIPVTERLPENEVDVLICAERRPYGIVDGERKTVRVISMAFYTDGKTNTEESIYSWDSDVDMQYDEENDVYIVPEGWWEVVNYGDESSAVDDFVTHWMPLPEPYKPDDAKMEGI